MLKPFQRERRNAGLQKPLILCNEREKERKVIYSTNPATNPTMARMLAALPLSWRAPLLAVVVDVAAVPEEAEAGTVADELAPLAVVVAELLLAMAAA
jgi:hypothetical protein